jgi:NAD(P)-dependent dehydrogenase (short-subunit alcohol dehydrogenase family)
VALHIYHHQYFNRCITSFMWCRRTAQSPKKQKNNSPVRVIVNCDVWVLQNAVVRGTLLGFQHMGEDEGGKGGVVVNMASIAGLLASPSFPIYVATKHAVIGLTRSFGVSRACSNV